VVFYLAREKGGKKRLRLTGIKNRRPPEPEKGTKKKGGGQRKRSAESGSVIGKTGGEKKKGN